MYYSFELNEFPLITQSYSVTRNTVWEIAEQDNMIIFIHDGSCAITCEHEKSILQKGDIYFIPANHPYCRYSIDNTMCTMSYIHFTLSSKIEQIGLPELIKQISDVKNTLDNQLLNGAPLLSKQSNIYLQGKNTLKDYSKVFQQSNKIITFSSSRELMSGLHASIVLCSILTSLSQNTIEQASTDSMLTNSSGIPDNLKKAIQYIRSHYTEPITLNDLTAHCNVSKQQLIRYFKTAFQTTPVAYITAYKISLAKELLFRQTHLSIKEISDELGFDNQHYFTRVFTKITGETPSDYRYRTNHFPHRSKKEAPQS